VAILAGETLQAMRSSLDYVAWQLALGRSDTPPPTTAFPIFAREKLYERDKMRFIGGIDPSIHPVFDSLQAYHAGDDATNQPLWVLHRLANDDKHKTPHVVGTLPKGVMVNRPAGVDLGLTMRIGPFEDGDEVATVGIIAGADPQMDQVRAVLFVAAEPAVAARSRLGCSAYAAKLNSRRVCEHSFVTSQGTRHGQVMTRFTRACEKGDVLEAEVGAREMPRMTLQNALRLVCVYAATDSEKFEPAAVRFVGRLIAERRDTTIGSIHLAAAALVELRGHRREAALRTLQALL
jgi:hypothetical protein